MLILHRIVASAGLLLPLLLSAETISFRNGRTVEEATVIAIDNGSIRFSFGDPPQQAETALTNILSVSKAASSFRIVRFEDHQEGKKKGRLLELQLLEGRNRLHEPLVRLYGLMQDELGKRSLHLFTNQKVKDPSTLYEVPVINAGAWSPALFFADVEHRAVAWHLEIWQDGDKVFDDDLGPSEFKKKWWVAQKPDRTGNLETPKDAQPISESAVASTGIEAVIRTARVHRGIEKEAAAFDLEWALTAQGQERMALPEATLAYIVEDADGARKLVRKKCEPDAGKEVAAKVGLTRTATVALDEGVSLTSGSATFAEAGEKLEPGRHLIYWRFAVHFGGRELTVRESANTTIRRSLGETWWKD